MKKSIVILLIFFAGKIVSQEKLFLKVKDQLAKDHPELQLENKLIIINKWSANDPKTREANMQVNKAATVYAGAKLKGGPYGIIAVLVCIDADNSITQITLDKDKVNKPVSLSLNNELKDAEFTNIVYTSSGKEVYRDLNASDVYSSIQKLITR